MASPDHPEDHSSDEQKSQTAELEEILANVAASTQPYTPQQRPGNNARVFGAPPAQPYLAYGLLPAQPSPAHEFPPFQPNPAQQRPHAAVPRFPGYLARPRIPRDPDTANVDGKADKEFLLPNGRDPRSYPWVSNFGPPPHGPHIALNQRLLPAQPFHAPIPPVDPKREAERKASEAAREQVAKAMAKLNAGADNKKATAAQGIVEQKPLPTDEDVKQALDEDWIRKFLDNVNKGRDVDKKKKTIYLDGRENVEPEFTATDLKHMDVRVRRLADQMSKNLNIGPTGANLEDDQFKKLWTGNDDQTLKKLKSGPQDTILEDDKMKEIRRKNEAWVISMKALRDPFSGASYPPIVNPNMSSQLQQAVQKERERFAVMQKAHFAFDETRTKIQLETDGKRKHYADAAEICLLREWEKAYEAWHAAFKEREKMESEDPWTKREKQRKSTELKMAKMGGHAARGTENKPSPLVPRFPARRPDLDFANRPLPTGLQPPPGLTAADAGVHGQALDPERRRVGVQLAQPHPLDQIMTDKPKPKLTHGASAIPKPTDTAANPPPSKMLVPGPAAQASTLKAAEPKEKKAQDTRKPQTVRFPVQVVPKRKRYLDPNDAERNLLSLSSSSVSDEYHQGRVQMREYIGEQTDVGGEHMWQMTPTQRAGMRAFNRENDGAMDKRRAALRAEAVKLDNPSNPNDPVDPSKDQAGGAGKVKDRGRVVPDGRLQPDRKPSPAVPPRTPAPAEAPNATPNPFNPVTPNKTSPTLFPDADDNIPSPSALAAPPPETPPAGHKFMTKDNGMGEGWGFLLPRGGKPLNGKNLGADGKPQLGDAWLKSREVDSSEDKPVDKAADQKKTAGQRQRERDAEERKKEKQAKEELAKIKKKFLSPQDAQQIKNIESWGARFQQGAGAVKNSGERKKKLNMPGAFESDSGDL